MQKQNTEFLESPENIALLLAVSDVEDIDILVDYITDKGEGRVSLLHEDCDRLVNCKKTGKYETSDLELISREVLLYGGNSFANLVRGSMAEAKFNINATLPYDEIVRDVAKHLKVAVGKTSTIPSMEDAILRQMFEEAFAELSKEEQAKLLAELGVKNLSMIGPVGTGAALALGRAGGFATYRMTLIVANRIARMLLGRGLPRVANAWLMKGLNFLMGPVGMAVTTIWTLADIGSPATRVMIPCVVQIAYMRQKAIAKISSATCLSCSALNTLSAKFCSECGAPMSSTEA